MLVDEEDWRLLRHFNLTVTKNRGYVVMSKGFGSRQKKWMAHVSRFLTGPPASMQVDHINGNVLDNRRSNLRFSTPSQNMANRRLPKNNKSGIRGVQKTASGKWYCGINFKGKTYALGTWPTARIAECQYKAAQKMFFGEFAKE